MKNTRFCAGLGMANPFSKGGIETGCCGNLDNPRFARRILRGGNTGVKRKEAGVQTPPLYEETPLKIPGFP
jgi:hypothetical protein